MSTRFSTAVAVAVSLTLGYAAHGDVVLHWNDVAREVLVANTEYQNPGMASRTLAMMNLAIYDAFAMTTADGTMYYDYGHGHNSPNYAASREAAASQAAYTVLSGIYHDQQSTLSIRLSDQLAAIGDGAAKTEGVALGSMIGQSILASRGNDGFTGSSQYQPTYAPGHWQPDPLNPGQEAWGPAWGNVQTFSLQSGAQFTAPPMPALSSQAYADAYSEVKSLGSVDSTTRTDEQLEIGYFWAYDRSGMGTPLTLYSQVLESIATQQGNTPEKNAALFAKASVAMADAGVAAWNSKFEYDFWRPVTGIRQGDLDGNDLTEADPNWIPLGAPGGEGTDFTPPFPTYVSGHATFGGALFATLAQFYGTDDIAFTLTSDELEGVERSFTSLSQAMAENGRSRVYLGIHWNFDDIEGQNLGAAIARHIMERPFIAAVPEPSAIALLAGGCGVLLVSVRLTRRRVA